jgi:phenylalanyl-tRNA synthetase beta chain
VTDSTRYDALATLIDKLKLPFLEEVEYVTTYRGKPIEKGQEGLTTSLVFRSPDATLTSEQVEPSVQRIIKAAGDELGGTLRA